MSTREDSRAAALLESGLRHFRQGQVEQARQSCEEALTVVPQYPDALHLLGVMALQIGDHPRAAELLQQAIATRPDHPDYLANLAYACIGLKRLPEALAAFQRAAALKPGDPDLQTGVGNCLALLGRPAEAEAAFRGLVERHPQYGLGWFNLAKAVSDQERHEEAVTLYRRVTQLAPGFAQAQCNLGIALQKLGRFDDAEQSYRACLARKPDFLPAYVNLAVTLNCLRQHQEAEALCRQALARDPGQANAWPILGRALAYQYRWHEAVQCYERAVREHPEVPDAHGDLGDTLARTGRMAEAMAAFDRALSFANVSSYTRFARAVALFSAGRIAEGSADYAGRNGRVAFVARHPQRPLAAELPQDLRGQEVCVLGEQGIGDEIFFLRFAPLLKARGCRLTVHAHARLLPLLARCTGLDRVVPNAEPFAAADHTLFAGDLLRHCLGGLDASPFRPRSAPIGPGMEARPYAPFAWHCRAFWPELPRPLALAPLPERVASVAARLRQLGPPPYTGVTWRAGTGPQEQRGHAWLLFKEIPLEAIAAALRDTAGTLLSLQRAPAAGETEKLAALAGRPMHDLSAANEDLEEMLALLSVLDEYVGVSSTNMHLRAAAGRAARVLVPWPAEWRWMMAGDESPWFPGFRVYRQRPDGGWSAALARLAAELRAARPL